MASLRRIHNGIAIVVLTVLTGAALASPAPAGSDNEEYRFKVFLDGDPIGYHHYQVRREGTQKVVESNARFDVKFLFVNVYSYLHDTTEVWQGNCLTQIDARTDDNGDDYFVRGSLTRDAFALATHDGTASLPTCVMTFSYWNPDFLGQTQLLNAQTGEYLPVRISAQGTDTMSVNGRLVECNRYRLTAREVDITLWYESASGQWAALESKTPGGHVVRYEKVSPLRPVQASASKAGPVEL